MRPYEKTPTAVAMPRGGRWIATEKVHGAHLSLIHTTDGVIACTRKRVLAVEDMRAWFGLDQLYPTLLGHMHQLPIGTRVYGELCGGWYPPHGDPSNAVQLGIAYAEELTFLAFAAETAEGWLSPSAARSLVEEAGMLFVPEIARGSLQQMMALPVVFPSRVPALFGLPPLEDNDAEGLVITHDRGGIQRPQTIKHKATAWVDGPERLPPRPTEAERVHAWLIGIVCEHITPARVSSARSKVGPDGDMLAEIVDDVWEDVTSVLGDVDREIVRVVVSDWWRTWQR